MLKVYFILLQRFRPVIMSDHSSEPILVSHCFARWPTLYLRLFGVRWQYRIVAFRIVLISEWSGQSKLAWMLILQNIGSFMDQTINFNEQNKNTNKRKNKKKKKTGSRRVFTFPVLACLNLVGYFWIPNVHYSVVSGLPWSSADRQ